MEGHHAAARRRPMTCSATARRRSRSSANKVPAERRRRVHRRRSASTAAMRSPTRSMTQHDPVVDRCEPQFRARVRPDQPGGQRRMRGDGQRQLRQVAARHAPTTPALMQGWGARELQLGVLGGRAARADPRAWRSTSATSAASYGNLIVTDDPQPDPGRLRPVQHHGAGGSRLPGWRRRRDFGICTTSSRRSSACRPTCPVHRVRATTASRSGTGTACDLTVNARLVQGMLLRGGMSTGTLQHRQLRGRREAGQSEPAATVTRTTPS